MTVKELIEALQACPPDLPVVITEPDVRWTLHVQAVECEPYRVSISYVQKLRATDPDA